VQADEGAGAEEFGVVGVGHQGERDAIGSGHRVGVSSGELQLTSGDRF
jgi:hypothetical protein